MTDLTPTDIASVSAGYWAAFNEIKLQVGNFSFRNHEYEQEPMEYKGRRICYMKATQGGFTEIEVLKSLHGMIHRKYPMGVLYMFPTSDDVNEFSKSRFNPLILANRLNIGRFVKKTDTASLKKINEAFLYLRGARLSQKVGPSSDVDESTKLRSIPVDKIVFDEVDLMEEEVQEKARQRMGHSLVKEEVYISNPTIPDFGIHRIFQQSDQRYWWRECQSCGEWTCAEKSFPECVKIRSDGTGYIGCIKCGKEVFIKDGKWIPDVPANSDFMHGYQWSQLSSVFNDPAEILANFTDPPEGNLGDVYRLRLGLPYSSKEEKLRKSDVLACCGSDIMGTGHNGPCAMGVDVGKIKHVVIGVKIDNKRYELVKVARCENFGEIHDLAKKFNVKSAVIDLRPYEETVRKFQREEKYRMSLCEYSDTLIQETIWNDKTGVVKVHRTSIFDATHRLITENQLTLPRQCPAIEQFAVQCCNCARFEEKNKRTKQTVFRYRDTGDKKIGAHYRNALNYFLLAASGWKIGRVGSTKNRQTVAVNDYARV